MNNGAGSARRSKSAKRASGQPRLAAVHAEGRSREEIFDAINAAKLTARGARILLWFNTKDVPMGGTTKRNGSPVFEEGG